MFRGRGRFSRTWCSYDHHQLPFLAVLTGLYSARVHAKDLHGNYTNFQPHHLTYQLNTVDMSESLKRICIEDCYNRLTLGRVIQRANRSVVKQKLYIGDEKL